MQSILSAALTVLSLGIAGPAFSLCPVGGSENSVGEPAPDSDTAAALSAFNASDIVVGQDAFLRKNGFCAVETKTVVDRRDCDDASRCSVQVSITRSYWSPATDQVNQISARYNRFPFDRTTLFTDDLAVDGLGERRDLDAEAATLVNDALLDAGIRDANLLMGASTLQAGQLACSHAVVPNPVAHCDITAGRRVIAVADQSKADALAALLDDLGATVHDGRIGAVSTEVALVACTRVVVPNAVARCSVVIAN